MIHHGEHRYTVVLPGVTDLSTPHAGWDPHHRSVRDLDQAAITSARYSGLTSNAYAQLVAEALNRHQIDDGAELVVVGHSFGADTAIDLATDPEFQRRYHITQVVATGYNSAPQLLALPPGSRVEHSAGASNEPAPPVLVVQNRRDLVVAAETLLPNDRQGVFGCTTHPIDADVTTVVFDGGWGGLGHQVDLYRRVFADQSGLPPADATAIRSALNRVESDNPSSMLAIDVSVADVRLGEQR